METAITAPVTFTPGAIREIQRLMNEPGFDKSQYLRVGVKGGGCSGMSYMLGFDSKQDEDKMYDHEGLTFIMNLSHGLYLAGVEIDWVNGLNARGFTFSNPNADSTCGCGNSFSV